MRSAKRSAELLAQRRGLPVRRLGPHARGHERRVLVGDRSTTSRTRRTSTRILADLDTVADGATRRVTTDRSRQGATPPSCSPTNARRPDGQPAPHRGPRRHRRARRLWSVTSSLIECSSCGSCPDAPCRGSAVAVDRARAVASSPSSWSTRPSTPLRRASWTATRRTSSGWPTTPTSSAPRTLIDRPANNVLWLVFLTARRGRPRPADRGPGGPGQLRAGGEVDHLPADGDQLRRRRRDLAVHVRLPPGCRSRHAQRDRGRVRRRADRLAEPVAVATPSP